MLKSYRHGESLNIIMPFAETNLKKCLHDKEVHYDQAFPTSTLKDAPVWGQMLGIAKGLNELLTKSTDGAEGTYHFDLKPANILASGPRPKDFTFLIADFGLSFRKSSDDVKRCSLTDTPKLGGVYTPPELRDIQVTRKYDIWSFGCILLEVSAFAIDSYYGIDRLDL